MQTIMTQRRGVTALLAMIFLVLFATLAVGFYASSTQTAVISTNEKNGTISLTAAESGMDFIRYQLSLIKVPPTTPADQYFSYVADHLENALEGSGNLGAQSVAVTSSSVTIPANPNAYIKIDNNGAEFRATLERVGNNIRVKTTGNYINAVASNRAVQMDYQPTQVPTNIFGFAVASPGKVAMQKGSLTSTGGAPSSIASILSAKASAPAISISGGTIGGDLDITAPGLATVTGGSVGGATLLAQIINQHTHIVQQPEFPYVDTSYFKPFAVNTYTGSGSTLTNMRIPAGMNPKFTGGATIQGILYVESPNSIQFSGNVDLQGFIVVENKNSSAVNVIDMRGNFSQTPLPSGPEFDMLRAISGVSMMAPTAKLLISGSVDSYLQGNVILGSFINAGSADWTIDKGSIIAMDPGDAAVFNGKTVKFTATGQYNLPTAGLKYSSYFKPRGSTYDEVKP